MDDHTVKNNSELLTALIVVLNRHRNIEGAVATLEYLKSAKHNYVQRDIDRMMNSLVLALDALSGLPPDTKLLPELGEVTRQYVRWISQTGERMERLAKEYEAGGGKLLSREEILDEVADRRGAPR